MTANTKDAALAVIDYDALVKKDTNEVRKLVEACESVGMFHLNLGESEMKGIYEDIPNLLKAGSEFFSLPANCDEKKQSIREGMERGYENQAELSYLLFNFSSSLTLRHNVAIMLRKHSNTMRYG